jgi:hypothetical protein
LWIGIRATPEAVWAILADGLNFAPRKTMDSHRNAHHRAWRETGFCGGHYVDYEGRPSSAFVHAGRCETMSATASTAVSLMVTKLYFMPRGTSVAGNFANAGK